MYNVLSLHNHHIGKKLAIEESDTLGFSTIRHVECEKILSPIDRCLNCDKYRKTLRTQLSRASHEKRSDRSNPSSHVNYRHLSSPEKNERLHNLLDLNRSLTKQLQRMKEHVSTFVEASGIVTYKKIFKLLYLKTLVQL